MIEKRSKKIEFESDKKQLLHLLAHSLYSNDEVFLRELISNSADAVDKFNYLAKNDDGLYEGDADLAIWIEYDKDKHTLTIKDNGIGMDYDEVITNLGTIAKSGTAEFLQKFGDSGKEDRGSLIGQFGVGFYSAFVVADKVILTTRRAGKPESEAVKWSSDGQGEYEISQITHAGRGTSVELHLREDKHEFLEDWRLKNIISKYSDHIGVPIKMWKTEKVEQEEGKDKDQDKKEEVEVKVEEVVNQASALWTLSKQDISDEQYKEFYKHISHDFNEPMNWSHNRIEGKLNYTTLLYLPTKAPFDLWNRDFQRGLKLYVQRVFIMDNADKLLPNYLRFVKGIVDSEDLPLNVSRELLQDSKVIETIKLGCVKRILSMLEDMAKNDVEKYQEFWKEFGAVIKEGAAEDFANQDRIAKLLRFSTTKTDESKQTVSLADYCSRMDKDQENIYFIIADSFNSAKNSPHLELFRRKGIEVILFSERVDEWLISRLTEFDGKKLKSIAKGDIDLGKLEAEDEKKELDRYEKDYADVVKQAKEILASKVQDVRLTSRLTDSPACVVSNENEVSANLKRMLKDAGQEMPDTKPILELNPAHPMIINLKSEQSDSRFKEWCQIFLDQAILAEGGHLDDPASFVKSINMMMSGQEQASETATEK